jgi:polyisoprenoid-binding protein YceI
MATRQEEIAPALIPEGKWEVVPERSAVGFKVKKLGLYYVKGKFEEVGGWVEVPDDPIGTRGEVVVQAKSISTRMPPRDWHLRTKDFLDVKRYPEIRISAAGVEKGDDGFRLAASFAIHGVEKPAILTAHNREGGILQLEGVIDRHDFGIRAPWHSEWIAGSDIHLDVRLALDRQG